MKIQAVVMILLIPLCTGCTLLGVESTKTETVTSTQSENQSRYQNLEKRVEELERRVDRLERE